MKIFEDIFKNHLEQNSSLVENFDSKDLDEISNIFSTELSEALLKSEESMLKERHEVYDLFRENNCLRWKKGFNRLESFIILCTEMGESFNKSYREKAVKTDNLVFDILVKHHARACLVSQEILFLLKGGFPDAALSRWRTLHEINVISTFIQKNGHDCAERFYYHGFIEKYKAAIQMKEYEDRLNAKGATEEELEDIKNIRDDLINKYGKNFTFEYGWACPYIYTKEKCQNKSKVTFVDIEKSVSLDHMRPYYKWASKNTHATKEGLNPILGLSEAVEEMLLVGPSNSGMVAPAHSLAISLMLTTCNLLLIEPNIDVYVFMKILHEFEKQIGEIFLNISVEENTK